MEISRSTNTYSDFTFAKGLNNKKNPILLGKDELLVADNINLSEEGTAETRSGYTKFTTAVLPSPASRMFIFEDKVFANTDNDSLYWFNGTIWVIVGIVGDYTAPCSFNIVNKNLFVFDGIKVNRRIYFSGGVPVVANVGIIAPTTTATVVVNPASGNLNGKYKYLITYLRSGDYATESNPSTETLEAEPDDEKVDLTSIPVSPDPQVTSRKIYRTTADGGDFYFIHTIADNTTTTYTDNILDTSIGLQVSYDNLVIPKGKYSVYAGGRLWVAGNTDKESYVYFSATGGGESTGVESHSEYDFLNADEGDGDFITGLGSFNNHVVVFKQNKIFIIDMYNTAIQKVTAVEGCIASGSISSTPYGVFYFSEQGYKMFDGRESHYIGENIEFSIEQLLRRDLLSGIVSIYNARDKILLLSLPLSADVNRNSTTFVFFVDRSYPNENNERRFPITRYTLGAKAFVIKKDSNQNERVMFTAFGTSDYLFTMDDSESDDGTAITTKMATGYYKGKNIAEYKVVRRIRIVTYSANNNEVKVGVAPDFFTGGQLQTVDTIGGAIWGAATWGTAIWGATGNQSTRVNFGQYGYVFSFLLESASTNRIKFVGFEAMYRTVSIR